MTGYDAPGVTMTPNKLFDEHMSDMSEAELKVVLCAVRKTLGWHKQIDAISLSQFEKMTGLSRQAVITGIASAIQRGVLLECGTGKRGVKLYSLSVISSQENGLVQNLDQSTLLTRSSPKFRPDLVQNLDTQKKGKKIEKKESTANAGTVSSEWDYQGVFEVVAANSFKVNGSIPATLAKRIGGVVKTLKEFENLPTANELTQFYRWRERTHSDVQYLKSAASLQLAIVEWRKSHEYRQFANIADTPAVEPQPDKTPTVVTDYDMSDVERMFNELSEKTK